MKNRVFRLDSSKHDFADHNKLGYYCFLSGEDGITGSGRVESEQELPGWAKGKKGTTRQGLFASKYNDVVSYMVPRDIPYIITYTYPKKTIYFNKTDVPKISVYSPWISSFFEKDFEVLPSDGQREYFTEKPPAALKQKQIHNPLKKLGAVYNVQMVDNLINLVREFKTHNINYTSEAMPETV